MADHMIDLTADNFDEQVAESDGIWVVDFWADWCGPCKAIAPVLEAMAEELEGEVKFGKINVDEQTELAQFFNIRSIPTLGFFKDGQTAGALVGAQPRGAIENALEQVRSA